MKDCVGLLPGKLASEAAQRSPVKAPIAVDVLQVRWLYRDRVCPANIKGPRLGHAMNGRETTDVSGHSGELAACFA